MSLVDRIRTAMTALPSPALLAGDDSVRPDAGLFTAAAVLVPIVDRPEPTVLLTRRTETLRKHAGQIAFPGGRADPEDISLEATALREAWEEVGLPPDVVRILGRGDLYVTGTRYAITPVIGIIPPDLTLRPQEAEVAEIFEVPLSHLLDPTVHILQQADFAGQRRSYYEITIDGRRIWGATAGMIVNLAGRLAAA